MYRLSRLKYIFTIGLFVCLFLDGPAMCGTIIFQLSLFNGE